MEKKNCCDAAPPTLLRTAGASYWVQIQILFGWERENVTFKIHMLDYKTSVSVFQVVFCVKQDI